MEETKKKKRGRPPLPEEEREARAKARTQKNNAMRKATGWERDKKYRASHPDYQKKQYANRVAKYHALTIRIPREVKSDFDSLLVSTGKTISELVLDALEKQYGVNLHADTTDQTHDIPTHQDDE